MTRSWMVAIGMGAVVAVAGEVTAQVDPPLTPREDACESTYMVRFPMDSSGLDLSAQSQLAEAGNWLVLGAGRSLRVLGPTGPRAEDAQMGRVRALAVANYLVGVFAVWPEFVQVGTFDELTPGERYAAGRDTVVVLTCWAIPDDSAP